MRVTCTAAYFRGKGCMTSRGWPESLGLSNSPHVQMKLASGLPLPLCQATPELSIGGVGRQVPKADLIICRTARVMPFPKVGAQARHRCNSESLRLGTRAEHVIPYRL